VPVLPGAVYTLKLEQEMGNQKFYLYNFHAPLGPYFVKQYYKTQFAEGGWNTMAQDHEKEADGLDYAKNNAECYVHIQADNASGGCSYTVALIRAIERGDTCQ
jgi:hypothetical protein